MHFFVVVWGRASQKRTGWAKFGQGQPWPPRVCQGWPRLAMAGQGQGWTTLVSQTGPTPTLANFGLPGPTLASKGWPTLASKGWSARTGQLWPAWDNLGQTETLGGRTSLQTPKTNTTKTDHPQKPTQTNTTKTDHPQKPTRPKDPKGLARLGRVGFWGVLFLHEVFKLQESYEK